MDRPAIDVLNSVENLVYAQPQVKLDNMLWQADVPALYICDGGLDDLKPCTCLGPSCTGFVDGEAPPDNAAIVVVPNNSHSAISATLPARAHQACP